MSWGGFPPLAHSRNLLIKSAMALIRFRIAVIRTKMWTIFSRLPFFFFLLIDLLLSLISVYIIHLKV